MPELIALGDADTRLGVFLGEADQDVGEGRPELFEGEGVDLGVSEEGQVQRQRSLIAPVRFEVGDQFVLQFWQRRPT